MPRQSISLTNPNDQWLKDRVESEEYSSKSEVVNELIRQARGIDFIRAGLIAAEQSGFTDLDRDQILSEIKDQARHDGDL